MRTIVKSSDILAEEVDVLICSANVHLSMSNGFNGATPLRGDKGIQEELQGHLKQIGKMWVEPRSIVRTGPGPLRVKHILHAVAIDGFYQSSIALVRQTVAKALAEAAALGARTVALPALATGDTALSISEFAEAVRLVFAQDYEPIEEVRIVLREADQAEAFDAVFRGADRESS